MESVAPQLLVEAPPGSDRAGGWEARWTVEKFRGDVDPNHPDAKPYEVVHIDSNLLMYGGASCLIECLIGNGTSTAAQTLTYFSNGRAYLGVGDSSTAAAATQTDLQAATNKSRKAMEATFPTHTDGTTSGAASAVWKSSWDTASGNYAWAEIGLFNASSGGRMLNRKVVTLGTKTNADTWTLSLTLTIS